MIKLDLYPSASQIQKSPSVYSSDSCMTTLHFNPNWITCECSKCSCRFQYNVVWNNFFPATWFYLVIIEMDYSVNEFVSWRGMDLIVFLKKYTVYSCNSSLDFRLFCRFMLCCLADIWAFSPKVLLTNILLIYC